MVVSPPGLTPKGFLFLDSGGDCSKVNFMEVLGESGTILLHDDFFGVSGPLVEDCSKMDFMEDCEDNCFLQGL
jgi:hypothetical protein